MGKGRQGERKERELLADAKGCWEKKKAKLKGKMEGEKKRDGGWETDKVELEQKKREREKKKLIIN